MGGWSSWLILLSGLINISTIGVCHHCVNAIMSSRYGQLLLDLVYKSLTPEEREPQK